MILLASWVTVLVADLALSRIAVAAGIALLLALLALHGSGALLRRMHSPPPSAAATPWWDLLARAIANAVVLLTGFAAFLGPALTGALAPFPIALSVVCAFTVAQSGHAGVLALLRGIVPGLDSFALFCFLVAVLINKMSATAAFSLATAAAVIFAVILATRS